MSDNPSGDERSTIDEEVSFWRGFIQWWAREKDGPIPLRAWDALAYAEAKHDSNLAERVDTKDS